MKRLLGVLLMLLTLHLTLARDAVACERHGTSSMMDQGHQMPGHDMSNMPNMPKGPAPTSSTECCTALTSCATTMAPGFVSAAIEPIIADASRPRSRVRLALSRVTAPETPPPRV